MRRGYYIFVLALFIIVMVGQLMMPENPALVQWYSDNIYHPFQALRQDVFGRVFFSIGDAIYIMMGITLLEVVVRVVYFTIRYRSRKDQLYATLTKALFSVLLLYVIFFAGWGGNYYKPSLQEHWALDTSGWQRESALLDMDSFLINKLNTLAPDYRRLSFSEIKEQAREDYIRYTNSELKDERLSVKRSLFGVGMHYMGVHGYYNPFTGEAQLNDDLPQFMLPFVVSHEMAHQTGVAAEGDANLLAYVLNIQSPNVSFKYSGYFCMWLYTHNRMMMADSNRANDMKAMLNPLTLAHVDTLKQLREKYSSDIDEYSDEMYDQYLKMLDQEEGIRSYFSVLISAWAWQYSDKAIKQEKLDIP